MIKRAAACMLFLFAPLAAAGERIESEYFPQPHLELESRWALPLLSGRASPELANRIIAESPFTELRLHAPAHYRGRKARVYMIIPPAVEGVESTAGFEVEWRTQGVFRPGRARPGDRALLFEGAVDETPLRDLIAYTFHIDARSLRAPVRFKPTYEIEEY